MNDGMLQDILQIERQIETELAQERARAEEWLASEKEAIDAQAEKKLRQAASVADRQGETRCQSARNAGAGRLREMRQHVRRLKSLSDAILRRELKRHLSQITGGVHHDHPDGQN